MTRNFRDPRRRAAYQTAIANHGAMMRSGRGTSTAYRRGYCFASNAPVRQSIAYAFWAAGVDNRRAHAKRRIAQEIERLR